MKILYLSGFPIPSRAAHAVHAMKMCQSLARNGHEVALFAGGRPPERIKDLYEYYGVANTFSLKLLPLAGMRGATLLSLPQLHRALRAYDRRDALVYARSIYGAFLAARMGFRIVYEAHAPPPHALIHWLEKRLFGMKGFQKLIVISASLKCIYLSTYGDIPRMEVCHDAADVPIVGAVPEYAWPGRPDRLQVGYVGHLYRGRGIDLILGCAERLPHDDFHIVGGTERDIQHWRSQGGANVYFHGFIPPAQVPAALSRCDVLLLPYQKGLSLGGRNIDTSSWMSPMKLFEYMAARKAIIASDLPVLREVLNENNALLVRPDDLDGWVSALRACKDQSSRERRAAAAYADFLANYTWDKRAARALQGVPL
ncbi:MAG: glycosyltransferase family 4 protein [Planctomycetes bacterium]|nr:glycosyltransferase family 4 protein [Planctomycetota bacterium]